MRAGESQRFYVEVVYEVPPTGRIVAIKLHTHESLEREGIGQHNNNLAYLLDFTTRQLVPVGVEDYSKVNYRIVPAGQVTPRLAPEVIDRIMNGDDTPPAPSTEHRPVRNNIFRPSTGDEDEE